MAFHSYYDNGFEKYSLRDKRIGIPTSPQTANQIEQLISSLNQGVQNVEVGAVQSEIFDAIPQQHFDEMRRLANLTGAKISVHAPIIDPAGFNQRGEWSETERLQNELQIKSIIDRAQKIDPKGNIPVNFHSTAGMPAYTWQKGLQAPEGEKAPEYKAMFAIDQESGKLMPLEYQKKDYLSGEEIKTADYHLKNLNNTMWEEEKLKILSYNKDKAMIEDRRMELETQAAPLIYGAQNGVLTDEEKKRLMDLQKNLKVYDDHIHLLNTHIYSGLNEMAHKFKKYPDTEGNGEIKEQLKRLEELKRTIKNNEEAKIQLMREAQDMRKRGIDPRQSQEIQNKVSNLIQNEIEFSMGELMELSAPKQFIPLNDFAKEKTAETVSNAAFYAYNKFKDNAPTLLLENFFPETALSRADSLKEAIKDSRERFENKLIKEKGFSKDQAEAISKKLIGATWDVGHINMLRKYGYSKEELVEEAKKIAPYVKHVHITDNFGYADSHLPAGMGDVPIKEAMRELEKRGFSGRAIMEAGGFVQHFKTSPHPMTLEYFNSPLYSYDLEARGAYATEPRWQGELYGAYSSGFGDILPEEHFRNLYGSHWMSLPLELGGQAGGSKNRFSDTPME